MCPPFKRLDAIHDHYVTRLCADVNPPSGLIVARCGRMSAIMASHYRNEIHAWARALTIQGYSTRKAELALRAGFPNEPVPMHTTLLAWRREDNESQHEELEDNETRIALRADELVNAKMDAIAGDLGSVRLSELVIASGVYRDKAFRRQDANRGATGLDRVVALIQRIEREEMGDGSQKTTETRAAIVAEGELP